MKVKRFNITRSTHFLIGSNSQSSRKTVRILAEKDYFVSRLPIAALENKERYDEWTRHIISELNEPKMYCHFRSLQTNGRSPLKLI
jgi:hypothetical protein